MDDDLGAAPVAQSGVVTVRQLHTAGLVAHDVERMLRRRELVRVHPRVYVDHTGPLTWLQRAWAAVLWAEPAALSHASAVRIGESGPRRGATSPDDGPIHVAVAPGRRLEPVPEVVVHRMRGFDSRVLHLAPPRIRLEDALVDLAGEPGLDLDAVAILVDACGARRTTPARLLETIEARIRLRRRERLVAVLRDAATGTCSALEQVYLERVARAHGLPEGVRQASHRHGDDQRYRDVLIEGHRLCVELDGRLVHGSAAARDADLERDLDAVVTDDLLTIRLSWGQVADRSCHTAAALGKVLQRRGWAGEVRPCRSCRVAA